MTISLVRGTVDAVAEIAQKIPEFSKTLMQADVTARLADRKSHIIIAQHSAEKALGFKVGYEISDTVFYSWLGGVVPRYRRQGIAQQLREAQELWAQTQGYTQIQVKSMNRFPAMLQLLIAADYHISAYEDLGDTDRSKIVFQKTLTPH